MRSRVQLGLVAAGAALFAVLMRRIGVGTVVANAEQVGWLFLPILALYGVAYACTTTGWILAMPRGPRPSFARTYVVTVSGFSLNYVTPLVNAGGEPFRAAAVAPWLGARGAAGSVVLHRVLHTLALLLVWLTALLLGLVLLPRSRPVVLAILAAAAGVAAAAWLVVRGHRERMFERGLDLLHRAGPFRRAALRLERHRGALAELDRRVAELYHRSPARFAAALSCEYAARCLYMLEYWLICRGVGMPVSYATAFLLGGLSSLALNLLFFIPFELGSKEGVLYLLFRLAGLDPRAGVYTAIVSRARDLAWIAVGLALLALVRHRRRERSAAAPAPEPAT